MEKWVLAVGYSKEKFNETQREWLKYGVFIRMAADMQEGIRELSKKHDYLLLAIFSDSPDYLSLLKIMRSLTKAPILVMKHCYDGVEKIAAIEAGADEYIEWPDSIEEAVASGRALIRRYTELNQQDNKTQNVLVLKELFISADYRKVFINAQEVQFPRREFDLFYLLASAPGRVYTPEQLYREVWGDDYIPSDGSLHSCVKRIRRKLETIPQNPCSIQTMRGVGYCFIQETA